MTNTKLIPNPKYKSKYYVGICELHHELLHGFNESSTACVKGHYLLMEKFGNYHKYINNNIYNSRYNLDDEDNEDNEDNEDDSDDYYRESDSNDEENTKLIDLYRYKYSVLFRSTSFMNNDHCLIRNYHNIIKSFYYIQPHIVECIYLPEPGSECVAILKTFWLKIVQRVWKKIYKQRMDLLKSVPMLRMREIVGVNCNGYNNCFRYDKIHIPGIRGMLHELYLQNKFNKNL
jgi:hypothetical protein